MTEVHPDESSLSTLDTAILNGFQGGFPICESPFETAAGALRDHHIEIEGDKLLSQIQTLDDRGYLSRFGALVNAEKIGGTATLVAMHAPKDRFETIAEQVNAHREVAHNYKREHSKLNMWFVVSVADANRVSEVLSDIESETGQETYNMPKKQEFRVEAKFPLNGPLVDSEISCNAAGPSPPPRDASKLTPAERDLLVQIQDGLPLTATPYADVATAVNQPIEWVLETLTQFRETGQIRRVGVVPNHYALGYSENGMTVWNVPDDRVDEVGPAIAALPFVTHCYERPRHEPVWEYNFFAMTHGRSEAESNQRITQVRDRMADFWEVSDETWDTLFSTAILKKTGIRLSERAEAHTE
jgi:DNA-binding Lrp family transcriptional regulator